MPEIMDAWPLACNVGAPPPTVLSLWPLKKMFTPFVTIDLVGILLGQNNHE